MTTTKKNSLRIKKIDKMNLYNVLSIKIKVIKIFKKSQINVYVDECVVLINDQNKNLTIKHKSLSKETYLFESINKKNLSTNLYLIEINALMINEINFVFMTNFEKIKIKIIKKQLLKRLKSFNVFIINTTITFDYASVFIRKYTIVKSKIKNSFVIEDFDNSDFEAQFKSNINDY